MGFDSVTQEIVTQIKEQTIVSGEIHGNIINVKSRAESAWPSDITHINELTGMAKRLRDKFTEFKVK